MDKKTFPSKPVVHTARGIAPWVSRLRVYLSLVIVGFRAGDLQYSTALAKPFCARNIVNHTSKKTADRSVLLYFLKKIDGYNVFQYRDLIVPQNLNSSFSLARLNWGKLIVILKVSFSFVLRV
ncbi:MAG: hypothetical protein AAF171_14345 [Cyanobacteria bacterium P01_A01_bin.116]